MKLTPKQQAFCEIYAGNGGNGTQAAIDAGYSAKTAQQMGAENLIKPVIAEYLSTLTKDATNNRIATAIERQTFLSNVMRGAVMDGENAAKLSDRIRCCEILGKMQGDFIERSEIKTNGDAKITIVREAIIRSVLGRD